MNNILFSERASHDTVSDIRDVCVCMCVNKRAEHFIQRGWEGDKGNLQKYEKESMSEREGERREGSYRKSRGRG